MASLVRLLADGTLIAIVLVAGALGIIWFIKLSIKLRGLYIPYVIMAGLTSLLVGKLMSLAYQPFNDRPFLQRGVEAGATYINNPGFPSDHALLATVIVLTIYILTPYKKVARILMVAVVVMSVARVLALVHTPIDVIGGILAGATGTVWYIKLAMHKKTEN